MTKNLAQPLSLLVGYVYIPCIYKSRKFWAILQVFLKVIIFYVFHLTKAGYVGNFFKKRSSK